LKAGDIMELGIQRLGTQRSKVAARTIRGPQN